MPTGTLIVRRAGCWSPTSAGFLGGRGRSGLALQGASRVPGIASPDDGGPHRSNTCSILAPQPPIVWLIGGLVPPSRGMPKPRTPVHFHLALFPLEYQVVGAGPDQPTLCPFGVQREVVQLVPA
jgi:hypothetical protein